jgi:hypothetical protein
MISIIVAVVDIIVLSTSCSDWWYDHSTMIVALQQVDSTITTTRDD